MSRPSDWHILDLDRDPTPGDPTAIRALARRVDAVADDAAQAERDVIALAGDSSVTEWVGAAGDVFRGALDDFPTQLRKLADSYSRAYSALTTWASDLDRAQGQADRALAQGREARQRVDSLGGQLSSARQAAESATQTAERLRSADTAPDPDQLRAATRNASSAGDRVSALSGQLSDAQGALDAAKRLARDAKELRERSGDAAASRLHDASDAGIEPNSFWDNFKAAVAKVWEVTIAVAKVLVLVLGIVVLIIGGPLAWVVVGLAMLILIDTLMKYANGEATLMDVGLAALGLIPGTKGLTSLGALKGAFAAGGTLGALRHIGVAGRSLFVNGGRAAQTLWQGRRAIPTLLRQVPFSAAARLSDMAAELRHGVPGAIRGFGVGLDLIPGQGVIGRLRTGLDGLGDGFRAGRSFVARTDPAYLARAWQRTSGGSYPGIDLWRSGSLTGGTRVEGLYPGLKGFVAPGGTMDDLGRDASRISEALQVGPSVPDGVRIMNPYRSSGLGLEIVNDVPAATSTARANMQYGAGGATQHFIPDFAARVQAGDIVAVAPDGTRLQTVIDARGGVSIADPSGNLIQLHNLDVRPGGNVWPTQEFGEIRGSIRPLYDMTRLGGGLIFKAGRLGVMTAGQ